jgi:hypothetical protein
LDHRDGKAVKKDGEVRRPAFGAKIGCPAARRDQWNAFNEKKGQENWVQPFKPTSGLKGFLFFAACRTMKYFFMTRR